MAWFPLYPFPNSPRSPCCPSLLPFALPFTYLAPSSCDRNRPPSSQVACKLTLFAPPFTQLFHPFQLPRTPIVQRLTTTTLGLLRSHYAEHLLKGSALDVPTEAAETALASRPLDRQSAGNARRVWETTVRNMGSLWGILKSKRRPAGRISEGVYICFYWLYEDEKSARKSCEPIGNKELTWRITNLSP
jgi:hypothetical protein